MRYGENADARVDAEHVITFEKDGLARGAEHPGQEYLDAAFGSADPKRFTR
jgi:hypothetical protein